MDASEVKADVEGDGTLTPPSEPETNWGWLEHEPCRYCLRVGGVQFLIDNSPFGKSARQVVQCTLCKRTWEV